MINNKLKIIVRALIVWMVVLNSAVSNSGAGELKRVDDGLCNWLFSGKILSGDADKFFYENLFLEEDSLMDGLTLCLDSPGGSLDEGLKIFDAIWDSNVATIVPEYGKCESACALAFLGGSTQWGTDVTRQDIRKLFPTSRLGFHGPSLNLKTNAVYDAAGLNKAFDLALKIAAKFHSMNVLYDRGMKAMSNHLYSQIIRTKAESMYYVDTIGDLILSRFDLLGVDYSKATLGETAIKNICDNSYLGGHFPDLDEPIEPKLTVFPNYQSSKKLYSKHFEQTEENSQTEEFVRKPIGVFSDIGIFAETDNLILTGYRGSYSTSTKYYEIGCLVSYNYGIDELENPVSDDDYVPNPIYDLDKVNPISISFIKLSAGSAVGASDWKKYLKMEVASSPANNDENFGYLLKEVSVPEYYLFPFSLSLNQLPRLSDKENDRSDGKWNRYIGYDINSSDIDLLRAVGESSCREACKNSDQCDALTYDDWNQLCFLKRIGDEKTTMSINAKAISHLYNRNRKDLDSAQGEINFVRKKRHSFRGTASLEFNSEVTLNECERLCAEDNSCFAYQVPKSILLANDIGCRHFHRAGEYSADGAFDIGYKVQAVQP